MKKKKEQAPEFSIETFLSGKENMHTQLYVEDCLDEDGRLISFSDQAAIVTHYLNLRDKEECKYYENKG